jgi:NADH:ubiquinone oxidoreductase subunit 6 (subunit J)
VKLKPSLAVRSFLIELVVYAVLVTVYILFVIGLLNEWLHGLYDHTKLLYAIVALLLIVIQGVVLEMVTSLLMKVIRSRSS